ncbi:hypothetical protein U9M48_023033, partial [Paspalum notatum var. saurae]
MGVSRRFLNLIVDDCIPGGKSLRCIDLTRHKLFNTTTPAAPLLMNGSTSESLPQEAIPCPDHGKKKNMRLPAPSINFRASPTRFNWWLDCLPLALAGRKLLCAADQSGRTTLFDADMRQVEHVPYLCKPKTMSLAIFIDHGGGDCSIDVMNSSCRHERGDATQVSHQFEAFVCRRPALTWQRQCSPTAAIRTSYAVVGGGSHICISAEDAGTYCLDTASHTWTQVGEWTLPFIAKVEYVPELKLWFGICAKDFQLGAADLSTMGMDSPPQLLGTWKEELEAPQHWTEVQYPQLVLHRKDFQSFMELSDDSDYSNGAIEEDFTVLTGTDVVPCVHDCTGTANATCSNGSKGKARLQIQDATCLLSAM